MIKRIVVRAWLVGLLLLTPCVLFAADAAKDYLVQFANKVHETKSNRVEHILVIEEPNVGMTCVQLAFKHGGFAYDEDASGSASVIARLYREGYEGITSYDYNKLLDEHGVSIDYSVTIDNLIISVCALPDEIGFAMKTLSSVLNRPKLDKDTIEKVRAAAITEMRYKATNDPESIARDAMHKRIFADHPYGNPSDGTVDSLKAITVDQIANRIRRTIITSDVVVSASGKITEQKLKDMLDKVFVSNIPISVSDRYIDVTNTSPSLAGNVLHVEAKSGKVVIAFAQKAYPIRDAKYPDYLTLTSWLGRSDLDSMLMRNAREVGLSYRVALQDAQYAHAAFTYGIAFVEPHKEEAMLHLINDVLTAASSSGPNYNQIESAKAYQLGKLAFALVSCKDRASFLMYLLLNDIGMSDILARYDSLNDVTEKGALKVAKNLFDARGMSAIVVG